MQTINYQYLCWIENKERESNKLSLTRDTKPVEDFKGRKLLLFTSSWNINWALERNPDLNLTDIAK